MLFWHGIPLGVDFRGGTLVYVKFSHTPDDGKIRADMDKAGLRNASIQPLGQPGSNERLIDVSEQETNEKTLDLARAQIVAALQTNTVAGKKDLNNTSSSGLAKDLLDNDPLHVATDAQKRYSDIAQQITSFRDKTKGGVLASFDDLKGVADPAVIAALQDGYFLSDFGVYQVEIVGPQVGE